MREQPHPVAVAPVTGVRAEQRQEVMRFGDRVRRVELLQQLQVVPGSRAEMLRGEPGDALLLPGRHRCPARRDPDGGCLAARGQPRRGVPQRAVHERPPHRRVVRRPAIRPRHRRSPHRIAREGERDDRGNAAGVSRRRAARRNLAVHAGRLPVVSLRQRRGRLSALRRRDACPPSRPVSRGSWHLPGRTAARRAGSPGSVPRPPRPRSQSGRPAPRAGTRRRWCGPPCTRTRRCGR